MQLPISVRRLGPDLTDAPARPRWRWGLLADVVLAAVLTAFAQINLVLNIDQSVHYGPPPLAAATTAVATAVLALRRLAPLATAATVALAIAGPLLVTQLTVTLWGGFLPIMIATYSVARHSQTSRAWLGGAVTGAAIVLVMLRLPFIGTPANVPFNAVPFVLFFGAGRVLRRRELSHQEERARTRELDAERDAAVSEAVAAERARIARELHDIVAHCVSVMVVQAGAAEDLLDRDATQARGPLRSVQETGRQAVGELSRMLGLLRGEGASLALTPQPGTAQLADLVQHMTGVGLPVDFSVVGTPRPLPPGVELTVYRVVQEALTNTLKHAAPTRARVELRYNDESVDVTIGNDGLGRATPSRPSRVGHGLIGMRERISLYGGSLAVGARPDGGFDVRAVLPLEHPS